VSEAAPRRLASIDLGTNTVRLLVVEAAEGQDWRPLYQTQRVTRLGEGQAGAGQLLEGPMRRTLDAVAAFVAEAVDQGARTVRVVGTSAVRNASNRDEFVARVREIAGCEVHVVSGEDEARLALAGVAAGLPALGGSFVLVDIGGGSTELIRAVAGRPVVAASIPLGVVMLAERFAGSGPVSADLFARMRADADERLGGTWPSGLGTGAGSGLVGTAGTVTTLAALDLGLSTYDAERVHGHHLRRHAIERIRDRLSALTLSERARVPGIERGRADLLIPGIAICLAVMGRLGQESLIVSDRGVREGILQAMLAGEE